MVSLIFLLLPLFSKFYFSDLFEIFCLLPPFVFSNANIFIYLKMLSINVTKNEHKLFFYISAYAKSYISPYVRKYIDVNAALKNIF